MSATDKQRKNRGKAAPGLKNLKPWKKGQSGNPKGRPRKPVSITSGLKEQLSKVPDFPDRRGDPNTKTWRDLIVDAILRGCLKGNHPLTKELLDRLEGKVTQPIDATLKGDVNFIIGKGYADDKSGI